MSKVGVLISVGRQFKDRFSDVVERIRAAGVDIDRASPLTAVIAGTADSAVLPAVAKIPEVVSVEEEREVTAI